MLSLRSPRTCLKLYVVISSRFSSEISASALVSAQLVAGADCRSPSQTVSYIDRLFPFTKCEKTVFFSHENLTLTQSHVI